MLRRIGLVGILVIVVLTVVPAGAPVQVSYVYSDSMEPTIDVNEGYIVIPAKKVEVGEIVMFWSPMKDTYVTHRIVGQTEKGFITKGDNNPSSDQRSGYSAVTRDEIVGEVLTFQGEPLVIPYLGLLIVFLQRHLLAILGIIVSSIAIYSAARTDVPYRRDVVRVGDIFQPLFLVGIAVIAWILAYGGVGHNVTLVAVASAGLSESPGVIAVGSSKSVEFVFQQPAWPLMQRVVGTHGMTVTSQTRNTTAIQITGLVRTPEAPGPVHVRSVVHQYPAIIPRSILVRLQEIHPLLASGISAIIIFVPLWVFYHLLLDSQTPLRQHPVRMVKILWRRSK